MLPQNVHTSNSNFPFSFCMLFRMFFAFIFFIYLFSCNFEILLSKKILRVGFYFTFCDLEIIDLNLQHFLGEGSEICCSLSQIEQWQDSLSFQLALKWCVSLVNSVLCLAVYVKQCPFLQSAEIWALSTDLPSSLQKVGSHSSDGHEKVISCCPLSTLALT